MRALCRLSAAAIAAGAFAFGAAATAAPAQVKITGKETSLANHSTYNSPIGDLPPAPKPGPVQYRNSFTCLPDGAAAPRETIAIHGQHDLGSTRAGARRPSPAYRSGK